VPNNNNNRSAYFFLGWKWTHPQWSAKCWWFYEATAARCPCTASCASSLPPCMLHTSFTCECSSCATNLFLLAMAGGGSQGEGSAGVALSAGQAVLPPLQPFFDRGPSSLSFLSFISRRGERSCCQRKRGPCVGVLATPSAANRSNGEHSSLFELPIQGTGSLAP